MHQDVFSGIYDVYFPKLLRFSQSYLIREEEAEHIVQDVFIYLWEHKEVTSLFKREFDRCK